VIPAKVGFSVGVLSRCSSWLQDLETISVRAGGTHPRAWANWPISYLRKSASSMRCTELRRSTSAPAPGARIEVGLSARRKFNRRLPPERRATHPYDATTPRSPRPCCVRDGAVELSPLPVRRLGATRSDGTGRFATTRDAGSPMGDP
jgi:hypothetical protein